MGQGLRNICLYLLVILFSASSQASSKADTYHELQNLKSDVRAAYAYALIVDKDGRAHSKRNDRINKIEKLLSKIDNLDHLGKNHKKTLSMAMRVYLRSAQNEAATYDVNLGSRTLSNGYSAYSELIEQIYASIQSIRLDSMIPTKTIDTFTLLDKIAEAIELHGERIIKTERVEQLTQNDLSNICSSIDQSFKKIAKYPDAQRTIKKASLKLGFIKSPICHLNKTSAPYTITHYGSLIADILKEYASSSLDKTI
jgi:hypothetical protein